MRVLWINCTLFPEASETLGLKPSVFDYWQESTANALLEQDHQIEMAVASLCQFSPFKIIDNYRIKYYLVPFGIDNQYYYPDKKEWYELIIKDFDPDIIHIHGSEYPHSLSAAEACLSCEKPFVVSIQGMVSVISQFYNAGLDDNIINNPLPCKVRIKENLKRFLGRTPLRTEKEELTIRGEYEKQLLKKSKHIIGRTSWDKAHSWAINPDIIYHHCYETMRPAFYKSEWSYDSCLKYSIFISQGNYPLKGLHMALKALPLVLRQFPESKLFIGGRDICNDEVFNKSGYAIYIQKLIDELNIRPNVVFLGQLDEEQMAYQYAHANVFISASSIENSPLSVGEAQLVGVPCIGSYVGGTMDMIEHDKTGLLYRFDDSVALASNICQLFKAQDKCESLSAESRKVAFVRHGTEDNAKNLLSIYNEIVNSEDGNK